MISAIETFTRHPYGLVRVTADDGVQGWGQMARMDEDVCATLLHRHLAPRALGRDEDPETLAILLEAETYKYRGSHLMRALAGLDTALWDLRARRAGVPVCVLAGGAPRTVPVYGSALRRDTTPEAEAERMLRLRDRLGLRAFKTKIGPRLNTQPGDHAARTRALIPALRRTLGPDISLMADANGSYRPTEAIAVGRLLEAYGYIHYEEPCPYWELEQTAAVAAALDLPVAGGEQDFDLAQFRRMIAMRAVDIVQPDVGYLGGFTRARGRGLGGDHRPAMHAARPEHQPADRVHPAPCRRHPQPRPLPRAQHRGPHRRQRHLRSGAGDRRRSHVRPGRAGLGR